MPSPMVQKGAFVRKSIKKTPTKKLQVEIGPSRGTFDTSPVRERVRQWQAQGGGVISASDICVEAEEDDEEKEGYKREKETRRKTSTSPVKRNPAKPGQYVSNASESDAPRQNGGRTREKEDGPGKSKHRSVSAPRKRIVSDSNWRKQRLPRESAQRRRDRTPPTKRGLQDDGIRVRPMPGAFPNDPDDIPKKKKETDTSKESTPLHDDGIRVYSTPSQSRRHSKRSVQDDDDACASDAAEDHSRRPSVQTPRSTSSRGSEGSFANHSEHSSDQFSSAEKLARRRRNSSRKTNARPGQRAYTGRRESTKSRILSQVIDGSKKIFTKNDPQPIAPPRVPTIESWLNGTPDPFVDGSNDNFQGEETLATNGLRHSPSDAVPDRSARSRVPPLQDEILSSDVYEGNSYRAKDANDVVERSEKTEHRSRIRINAYESPSRLKPSTLETSADSRRSYAKESKIESPSLSRNIELDAPDLSPTSLRRHGARRDASSSSNRERSKSSPLRDHFVPLDVGGGSNISSANSTSSVEPCDPVLPLRSRQLHSGRPFQSSGSHRLSTIASVETFSQSKSTDSVYGPRIAPETAKNVERTMEIATPHEADAETRDKFDPDFLHRRSSKNRLTKHSDLISVLSVSRAPSKSIRSARSIRTNRSRLATATMTDIMAELATDEIKYMRELRTLVDGVIPVLLSCVLSKTDAAIAAGLFSSKNNAKDNPAVTKPIYDMGIALERLKRAHKRIPLERADSFLTWAQGTQNVYHDYLKAWRTGFQDVIVNLAPASEEKTPVPSDSQSNIAGGLPRNEDGDVVDGNGERVDVAFLLKRPLVRLKYLAKTLKGIHFLSPSAEAESLAAKYQDLIEEARKRSNEERARLEDEAAANIDPTRARDPRTIGPLTGVTIDDTRSVRARDCFNLTLLHTSGQNVDCRIELFLRDNGSGFGNGGDVLICEMDGSGRWLLFPPVLTSNISARNGDSEAEIVVMIRGLQGRGQEWHEILTLHADNEETGFEWVQMLGLTPIPPKIMRMQSFLVRSERRKMLHEPAAGSDRNVEREGSPSFGKSRTPSPHEMEVPIGEQANGYIRSWVEKLGDPTEESAPVATNPDLRERAKLQKRRPISATDATPPSGTLVSRDESRTPTSEEKSRYTAASTATNRTPHSLNEALEMAGSPSSAPRSGRTHRSSRRGLDSVNTSDRYGTRTDDQMQPSLPETSRSRSRDPVPQVLPSARFQESEKQTPLRTSYHGSKSFTSPSELPSIPNGRKGSLPVTPIQEAEEELEWSTPETSPKKTKKLSKRQPDQASQTPPAPPPHRSPDAVQLKGVATPDLSSPAVKKTIRRPSSPLKHEYEPSTASESSSDSDTSTVEHNEVSSVSDSSEDEELEDGDVPTPLLPLGALRRLPKIPPPQSFYSVPGGTLGPSQSASQAPYKNVPAQPNKAAKTIASIFYWSDKGSWENLHPDECSISVTPGLIEAFEMSSAHSYADQLGANLALPSSRASSANTPQPLIGLELTPLVPIRRGTALDISIRSPPTADSKITGIANNNILFRSRSAEECEALYALINYARINNPTYIALQNARATSSFTPQFGGASFHRSASSKAGSRHAWFGFGGHRGSYRASSAPTPSVVRTESSIGSMGSAFSALRRFGQKSSRFSISRSTVTSRQGSRSESLYTTSDHSSGSGAITPPTGGGGGMLGGPGGTAAAAVAGAAPLGLSNAKIRLYIRETASKWRDLGAARLTIMRASDAAAAGDSSSQQPASTAPGSVSPAPPPPPSSSSSPGGGAGGPSKSTPAVAPEFARLGTSPHSRQGPNDKRVVVIGKSKGDTLLDVTLGESCFERVARTGIAVSVWETFEGGLVAKQGGVVGGRFRVYMVQMKSEAETAYTFSIVGKLRY